MILSEQVKEKFKSEIAQMPSWKGLATSQFVEHLATTIGWAVEDAAYKVERARGEAFIDSALNRSSILAHGESMEFIPRKPTPATGKIAITNSGEYAFTLLRETVFMGNSQNMTYTLAETVVVNPGETVEAIVEQRSKQTFEYTVDESAPFYEILIDRELSGKIVSFNVFVAEDGENFVEWEYDRLLTNSYPESLVYDEFYHYTDQIGIRFGNGDFGKIPPAGSIIRVEAIVTEGDTTLLEKQTLNPTETIWDERRQVAKWTITVSETIQNGEDQESTEEMRRDLHYAPVYNERLVWDNDYNYFLRRRYPEIVFAVAWGEEESEKMWGYNIEHINKIWICAYSPERDIKELALAALKEVPLMCRNFVWHEPEHVLFTLQVTGRVLKDCIISEVKEKIEDLLTAAYGRDSRERRDTVLLHEIYDIIQDTGYFDRDSGAWFEVEISGKHKAELIYQMISIDMKNTAIELEYVDG